MKISINPRVVKNTTNPLRLTGVMARPSVDHEEELELSDVTIDFLVTRWIRQEANITRSLKIDQHGEYRDEYGSLIEDPHEWFHEGVDDEARELSSDRWRAEGDEDDYEIQNWEEV